MKDKLKRKTLGSPTGLEPPSLSSLMDNVASLRDHPERYNEKFLIILHETIEEAEKCMKAIKETIEEIENKPSNKRKKK